MNVKTGISNLIGWIPTIWKDRQYDHVFIYEILKKKLELTEKYIRIYGSHENSLNDANRIKLCIKLLDRLLTDYYSMESYDYFESDFDIYQLNRFPNLIVDNLDTYFKLYPREYKKIIKDFPIERDFDKIVIAFKISTNINNKAKQLLFKILEKDIEKWWE